MKTGFGICLMLSVWFFVLASQASAQSSSDKQINDTRRLLIDESRSVFCAAGAEKAEESLLKLLWSKPQTAQWDFELAGLWLETAFYFRSKGDRAAGDMAAQRSMHWLEQAMSRCSSKEDADLISEIYETAAVLVERFLGDTPEAIELYRAAAESSPKAKEAYEAWKRRVEATRAAEQRREKAPRS